MRLQGEDLVRWLREAYFAVDGLWFLTLEERLGLEAALEVDVEVWRRFAKVMARRVVKRLNIDASRVEGIVESLQPFFDWEGWEVDVSPHQGLVKVRRCPWWDYLQRVGRSSVIKYVCPKVCEGIFSSWAAAVNPKARLKFTYTPPSCEASFEVEGG